jgi:hypothetical protein
VKTQLAVNDEWELQADSIYTRFLPAMTRLSRVVETGIPAEDFANALVGKVLSSNPPRYWSSARSAWNIYIMRWLPRALVLTLIWHMFST